MNHRAIAEAISQAIARPFVIESCQAVHGGCINDAFHVVGSSDSYFVKTNRASWREMFVAEAEGLQEMAQTETVRVPRVICYGHEEGQAFLVLEHLSLQSLNAKAQGLLGQQLAKLHRTTADYFGWHRDNTIGSTPQINTATDTWPQFYVEHRLRFQMRLAAKKGLALPEVEALCHSIGAFFPDGSPQPSLLHGDLWRGNAAMVDSGNPVIFDPACYFGDRETDLAFTEMFGGFGQEFYQAYQAEWPLDSGYKTRKDLYNLYHLLNHYNLFGGSYGVQAQAAARRLMTNI